MKTRILILAALLIVAPRVWGAEIPYEFTTVDIAVPGHPELVVFPIDIDDQGRLASHVVTGSVMEALVVKPNGRLTKFKSELIHCPNADVPNGITSAMGIVDGIVMGECSVPGVGTFG